MRTITWLALFTAAFLSPALRAQDLNDVFDDGVKDAAQNVVRTNLMSLYRGEVTMSYERLSRSQDLGLQVGLGIGLGNYRPGVISELLKKPDYDLSDASGTNSLFVSGKMYHTGINRSGLFSKLGVRSQGYRFEDLNFNSFRFTDILTGGGIHFLAFNRVTVDGYSEVVFRIMGDNALTEVTKRDPSRAIGFDILFQLGLEVGYLF